MADSVIPDTPDTNGETMNAGYYATCECGWTAGPFEELESAGHVADLHEGDEHFDDDESTKVVFRVIESQGVPA